MSLRQGRKPIPPDEPDTGAADPTPSVDDEIEILEVTGVNETERPIEPVMPMEPEPTGAHGHAGDHGRATADPNLAEEHASLQHALAEAARERDQKHDLWMRAQADLDNMKKRFEREAVERRLTDAASLFRRLLPVLDNLERALGAAGDRDDPLKNGVALIHHQLVEAMAKEGLAPIASIGAPFDPSRHDAVDMIAAPGRAAGTILEEMQKGYTLKDRLVRPALVRVAAGTPTGDASEGKGGDQAA